MYNRNQSRPVQSKLLELPNIAKIVNVLYNRSKLRPMQRVLVPNYGCYQKVCVQPQKSTAKAKKKFSFQNMGIVRGFVCDRKKNGQVNQEILELSVYLSNKDIVDKCIIC